MAEPVPVGNQRAQDRRGENNGHDDDELLPSQFKTPDAAAFAGVVRIRPLSAQYSKLGGFVALGLSSPQDSGKLPEM
jgi:hypothetical protein